MSAISPENTASLYEEFSDLRAALDARNYPSVIELLREAFNVLMEQERFGDTLVLHQTILQALPDVSETSEIRLWCLLGIGNAHFQLDQNAAAEGAYERMRSGAFDLGDDFLRSVALTQLGDLARKRGQREQAEQSYGEAIEAKLTVGDPFGVVEILLWLATLAEEAGQWQQATKALTAAGKILGIFRRAATQDESGRDEGGEEPSVEQAYDYWKMALWFQRASLRRAQGDLRGAQRIYRTALRAARTQQNPQAEAKLLQNLAGGLVEQGLEQKAIPIYEESLRIAQANLFPETARQVHQGLAIVLFRLKRYAESIPHYELAREAIRETDQNLWAALTGDVGAVYAESGDLGQGAILLGQALTHFQATADVPWQERVLRNFLLVDARQGEKERFQVHLHGCLNLLPKDAFQARRSLYHFAGNLYLDVCGDAHSAARCFRQAVEEEAAGGDLPTAGQTAALAGAALSQGGAPQEALALFDRAAELFMVTGDEPNLWRTRNDRGIALSRIGDHEEAAEEFSWCLRAAVEQQDRPQEAQALLNLGEIQRLIGEVNEAISHEERALAIYQAMEDQWGELDALNSLGLCLIEEHRQGGKDRAEEAFPLFEQARRLAKRLKSVSQEAMATRGLATVAERRAQVAVALRLYRRAADLWEREGDYVHCTEAMAARVTLQIIGLDFTRWQQDVEHLLEVAIKGKVVGKAVHGIVGAALHLINGGALDAAAELVRLAVNLHQQQSALSPSGRDPVMDATDAGDDYYRTVFFVVDAMERLMSPDERAGFLNNITRPDAFNDPSDGDSLRETIEQVRDELINEGRYKEQEPSHVS